MPGRLHGAVDVVTIGVPCTAYSTANKKKALDAQEATKLLWVRAFEIADLVLKPNGAYVCENPSRTELTGCVSRPVGDMEEIRPGMYKTEVNYCRYSEPSAPELIYSWKKTTVWSNVCLLRNGFSPLRCTAKLGRCCVGAIDPPNRSVCSFQPHGVHLVRLWQDVPTAMGHNAAPLVPGCKRRRDTCSGDRFLVRCTQEG